MDKAIVIYHNADMGNGLLVLTCGEKYEVSGFYVFFLESFTKLRLPALIARQLYACLTLIYFEHHS